MKRLHKIYGEKNRVWRAACLLLFGLGTCFGFAQKLDSLQLAYKNLPEIRKNDSRDTMAAYLLYKMVHAYTADSLMGIFSAPLKELAEKRLTDLPAGHPLLPVYKIYLATAMNDIGIFYRERGDALKSLEYLDKSLKLYEELHNMEKIGEMYNNIATVYYDIGDKARALEVYEKSYLILEANGGVNDRVQVLANLAYLNFVNKRYEAALKYYRICLDLCVKNNNQKFRAECINGMGLVYDAKGLYQEALEMYRQSLKIREEINDEKGIATSFSNIGNTYTSLKKYPEALVYLKRALDLSRQMSSFERMRQSAYGLKILYERLGSYREALGMHELYIQMKDSTDNAVTRKAALKKQLQYEYDKKEIHLKEEQARLKKLYEQKQRFSYVLSVILLVLILIVFYLFYMRYKLRKEKESKDLHIELKERLKQEIKEKETIANSLINIQEHEREKLAAELHDGVNQLLFAAKMQLQASKSVDEPMHREAVSLVDTAINEIKSIATNQGSFLLKNRLLKDALTDLVLRMKGNQSTGISFFNHGFEEDRLNQDQKINILRIIQELLNNTIKHAMAKECYISVKTTGNTVVFAVTDTGKGMLPGKAGNGNGLKNISNKVALMKGIKRTFSIPGKGTKVYIKIPLS